VSATSRSGGKRRSAVAGSRARALAVGAFADIAIARSQRVNWEKLFGTVILQEVESFNYSVVVSALLKAAAMAVSTGHASATTSHIS
jgi:hypothetical protein